MIGKNNSSKFTIKEAVKMRKEDFIRLFLPDTVEDVKLINIDLDITDLGIPDILRNLNELFPIGNRGRNLIKSGRLAVGIRCRTELLYPLAGLALIISNEDAKQIISKDFAVAVINEESLNSDESIHEVLEEFEHYLIREYKDYIDQFEAFFIKFLYETADDENEI